MAAANVNLIDSLAELARQVRRGTLELLQAADPRWLTWAPPGTSNHMLWHAGHAVWLQDALTVRPLTGHSDLPPGWTATFGQHSWPATIHDWPAPSVVRRQLEEQLHRILKLLAAHATTIVSRAYEPPSRGGWPLMPGMIHGWHDEARHQGEMYLLYKLRGAGAS